MIFYIIEPLFTDKWWSVNECIGTTQKPVYAKNRPPFCPVCNSQLSRYLIKPLEFNFVTAKPFFVILFLTMNFYSYQRILKKLMKNLVYAV